MKIIFIALLCQIGPIYGYGDPRRSTGVYSDSYGRVQQRVEAAPYGSRTYTQKGAVISRTDSSGVYTPTKKLYNTYTPQGTGSNTTRYYDRNKYVGKAVVEGNTTRFYNDKGIKIGEARKGSSTTFHSANNKFQGSKK